MYYHERAVVLCAARTPLCCCLARATVLLGVYFVPCPRFLLRFTAVLLQHYCCAVCGNVLDGCGDLLPCYVLWSRALLLLCMRPLMRVLCVFGRVAVCVRSRRAAVNVYMRYSVRTVSCSLCRTLPVCHTTSTLVSPIIVTLLQVEV